MLSRQDPSLDLDLGGGSSKLMCLQVRGQMHEGLLVPCVCKSLSFVSLRQNSDLGKERKPMHVRVDCLSLGRPLGCKPLSSQLELAEGKLL